MNIFGTSARGCYFEVTTDLSAGLGASFTLSNSSGLSGGELLDLEGCFISGLNVGQKEKYSVVQCFNDHNYLYAFGHDPTASTVEVTLTTFIMNKAGDGPGTALRELFAKYSQSRISKNSTATLSTITIGGAAISGFTVGMSSATQNPEYNLQSFTFILILPSPPEGS